MTRQLRLLPLVALLGVPANAQVAPHLRPLDRALLETAREARLATEQKNNATPEIIQAWRTWSDEASASVARFRN